MQSIIKPSAILAFLTAFLILAAACSSDRPTNTAAPQSAGDIEKAAEKLWDDWSEATQARDTPAFYSLLARNITDLCTLEQMERFFEMDENAFTYPEMDLKEVFVVAGNSESAFMTMKLRNEPRAGEQGVADTWVANIPYPIVRENGRWLMYIFFPVLGDGCPFTGGFSSQEAVPIEGPDSGSP